MALTHIIALALIRHWTKLYNYIIKHQATVGFAIITRHLYLLLLWDSQPQ